MKRRHFIKLSAATGMMTGLAPLKLFAGNIPSAGAVLQNKHFSYHIAANGRNLRFVHLPSGIDYLAKEEPGFFAVINDGTKQVFPQKVQQAGNMVNVIFNHAEVNILTTVYDDYLMLEVAGFKGDIISLSLLNMPLSVDALPGEPFGACLLSQNLQTYVKQLPALQTFLEVTSRQQFGITGSKAALTGMPANQVLPAIRDIMQAAKEVPFSDAGGAWAVPAKEGHGSYLMNFGTLTEENADEWIATCDMLGFNQIDNHGGEGFFTFGDFVLNKAKWKDGWDTYKRINKRLHEAGISSLFHTYAFFIEKTSSYVTPVPHKELGYFRSFTLAAAVGENDTEITVNESTADISLITGFFVRNSLSLRLGNELVEFTGVTKAAPFRFTGCKRGVLNTVKQSHAAGEQLYHLKELFGMFVAGHDSELIMEIARHTAEIANTCGFNGLYFDAIDGADILAGEHDSWYYSTRFIFEVARHLDKPVGMEFSSMKHHWWHYRSRWQAWDTPTRGYKRFIDIHSAAIKSGETEHGLWQGHLPEIKRLAALKNGRLLLPLHFGWWINRTWEPPQVEPTFPDDIEYLCCKMIGNEAGLSMQEVEQKMLEEKPAFRRLFAIIKQYEALRHQDYFSEEMKALLRRAGAEFTLVKNAAGDFTFKPVTYHKHKIEGLSHETSSWIIPNEYDAQTLQFRLEVLMAIADNEDAEAVTITSPADVKNFTTEAADGITGTLVLSAEKINGQEVLEWRAESEGLVPQDSAWIKAEKTFEPVLNLEKTQGLGVWIKGDGSGALLNIRLESPKHLSNGARGDHFVKLDFKGWKYRQLAEIESTAFSNYKWPSSDFYVYDSFRHTIKFNAINKIQFWYNNLPKGKRVNCAIGPVKALPLRAATVKQPYLVINGNKLLLPFEITSGEYLELINGNECVLFNSVGKEIGRHSLETPVPGVQKGANQVTLGQAGSNSTPVRALVTVITSGNALDAAFARKKIE